MQPALETSSGTLEALLIPQLNLSCSHPWEAGPFLYHDVKGGPRNQPLLVAEDLAVLVWGGGVKVLSGSWNFSPWLFSFPQTVMKCKNLVYVTLSLMYLYHDDSEKCLKGHLSQSCVAV